MNSECRLSQSDKPGEQFLLLSPQELRSRYADAAAQARLLAGMLRLAERVGRRRAGAVLVPVRIRRK